MEYRAFGGTGLQVSTLGFGASPFGGVFGAVDEDEAIRAVHTALDSGINYFDVSPYYGITKAETVLGKTLNGIPRDKYLLSTKVGRYGDTVFDFSAARVTTSVDESLARLNTDYADIILCHDIEYGSLDQIINETLPALRKLQSAGKVRFIGVSGLPLKIFRYVSERADLDVILSYCRYTVYDTMLADFISSAKSPNRSSDLGITNAGIINASPLGMGLLTEQGPPDWHPAPPALKAACAEAVRYCKSKGADISKLALQFSTSNPDIATTLVGISSAAQVERNVRLLDEPLDYDLLAEVQAILAPVHNLTWQSGRPENND
jgi:L-galactose dehydrogenase